MKTSSLVHEFLGQKRFAMIGVSRNPKAFSRILFKEFVHRGYEVVPINKQAQDIEGRRCYVRIGDVKPAVSSALLMTPRETADEILKDCVDAGVTLVWIYGISGAKDVDPGAIKVCSKYGIRVVPGLCPFMFMPAPAFYHRLHGFVWKVFGKYPA